MIRRGNLATRERPMKRSGRILKTRFRIKHPKVHLNTSESPSKNVGNMQQSKILSRKDWIPRKIVQNAHGWEYRKIKYPSCWNTHLVKLKIPGRSQLCQRAGKFYRMIRRLAKPTPRRAMLASARSNNADHPRDILTEGKNAMYARPWMDLIIRL